MASTPVYLSLGSNMGTREEHLRRAVMMLRRSMRIEKVSPVYETAPQYVTEQPKFLNIAVSGQTRLTALQLLTHAKRIEQELGRTEGERFGPRPIDIDILFYGDENMDVGRPYFAELTIPHPRIAERAFVLYPLADIAPSFVHPVLKKTVIELRDALPSTEVKKTDIQLPLSTKAGATEFHWGTKTSVMGIINITPDSFSGDGLLTAASKLNKSDAILGRQAKSLEPYSTYGESDFVKSDNEVRGFVELAIQMVKDGADIIDVGGESTRPGSSLLPLEEELARVIPVIKRLAAEISVPISIDTYKAEVARQALAAGATIINDVWGGKIDSGILKVAAETSAPIILMHNRSQPKNAAQESQLGGRYVGMEYTDVLGDIKAELQEMVDAALSAGVLPENIIVDPGIGFGKTVEQNLELLSRFQELQTLGFPVLSGPSRKSFVGYTLNLPPEERLEGTAAAVALSIEKGADIVRVHDVKEMHRVAAFTDAVARN